jgi:wyosine [tRNA(Phe)-imidazoG37] synthetase (radical SAM superfamily)
LGKRCEKTVRRQSFGDFSDLAERLKKTLKGLKPQPDYITFSGVGEPTLNIDLGQIAREIKKATDIPLAILTNASLATDEKVRAALEEFDLVVAKLDAPTEDLFKKINRPHPELRFQEIIRGIKKIRAPVAIQTMLLRARDFDNTKPEVIDGFIRLYKEISPCQIQLDIPSRPTPLNGARGKDKIERLSETELREIAERVARETGIKTIYYQAPKPEALEREALDLTASLKTLLARRPATALEASLAFGVDEDQVLKIISQLEKDGLLERIDTEERTFYKLKPPKG